MYRAILLFILIQLTLLARYVIFGQFERWTYWMTWILPFFALFLYAMTKNNVEKEQAYVPTSTDASWNFPLRQSSKENWKPLYEGGHLRGRIMRYYDKAWQRWIADFFESSFYLSLRIQIDDDMYDIRPQKKIANQSYWHLYKNDVAIGRAETLVTLKNMAKLQEVIRLEIDDLILMTSASTVKNGIIVKNDAQIVGSMRTDARIQHMQFDAYEPAYLLALVLHRFHFDRL